MTISQLIQIYTLTLIYFLNHPVYLDLSQFLFLFFQHSSSDFFFFIFWSALSPVLVGWHFLKFQAIPFSSFHQVNFGLLGKEFIRSFLQPSSGSWLFKNFLDNFFSSLLQGNLFFFLNNFFVLFPGYHEGIVVYNYNARAQVYTQPLCTSRIRNKIIFVNENVWCIICFFVFVLFPGLFEICFLFLILYISFL